MKTDISEKKPAGADFSAKDSAKKPAGKSAGKRAEFSAKKPARKFAGHSAGKSAGKPAEESVGKPAEKYTGKPAGHSAGKSRAENPAWKSAEEKLHASKLPAANSAAKKPTSRLKSGEATASAEKHAASRRGGTAKTREYPAKAKEFRTTGADGAAKSIPAVKKPKAAPAEQKPKENPAERKPIATTGRAVPADETAFLRTLGLAARARQTVMGTDMVCDALAEGRVRLVVEAGDTSENTHKRLTDKCITYRTPHIRLLSDGGTLGAALGKSGALAVCGVTGEIAKSLFAAWERLTASVPTVPEKVAKTRK